MPLFKYMVIIGALLLASIIVTGRMLDPAEKTGETRQSSSLELLRKMANHGEVRQRAAAAASGPFLAMPAVIAQPLVAASPAPAIINPTPTPVASSSMNAQARLAETDITEKPTRPAKKVAARKPRQRLANVRRERENMLGIFEW